MTAGANSNPALQAAIKKALADWFGFHQFRPHQAEIVSAILKGRDVFAVMPTGGGKSLCYQLPAQLLNGVAVVVSPLISLMKDQVDAAKASGLMAAALNSATASGERARAWRELRAGRLKLLYVSPERLGRPDFIDELKTARVSFFAVDEAHCISEWGHDFRPDYLELAKLSLEFPGVPLAAFTATATPKVAEDIINRLRLKEPHLTRASFNRPNLFYQVRPKTDLHQQIADFLNGRPDEAGIIYRLSRKNVEKTAEILKDMGFSARAYHAGLDDRLRGEIQETFSRDECQIIVATIAFGMGIDKSNVRFVIHGDLPKNLEGYYQETGRSGRDGAPAHCLLLYGRQEMVQLRRFADELEDPAARTAAKAQLRRMIDFAQGAVCRRKALLAYFGEDLPGDNCGGCDICLGEVKRQEATVEAQKALSAMARTGGRFGVGHLVEILMGSATPRLLAYQHHLLPTFGVGRDQTPDFWQRVIGELVAQGLAQVTDPDFPTPLVTATGWQVLRGQRPFSMLKPAPPAVKRRRRREITGEAPYCQELFAKLKEERLKTAQAQGLPPYIVFSDQTLREMARLGPQTPESFLEVSGVGRKKLETYGPTFMEVIKAYVAEHPEEKFTPPAKAPGGGKTRTAPPAYSQS